METYRVLLADPDAEAREQARITLTDAGERVVAEVTTLSELQAEFDQHRPEAVLLSTTLLPLSQELRDHLYSTALVILRDNEINEEIRNRIAESAAFATLTKPFTADDAIAELALAVSRNNDLMSCHNDLQNCHSELDKVQTRLADRIVIEKAKGLLIQHLSLSEPEAFKQIHFSARKANRTMRNVAEEIIAGYADNITIQ